MIQNNQMTLLPKITFTADSSLCNQQNEVSKYKAIPMHFLKIKIYVKEHQINFT